MDDYTKFLSTIGTSSFDVPGFDYGTFAPEFEPTAGLQLTGLAVDSTLASPSIASRTATAVAQLDGPTDGSGSPSLASELVQACSAVNSEPTASSSFASTSAADPQVTIDPTCASHPAAAEDPSGAHTATPEPEKEPADPAAAHPDAVPDAPVESQDAHATPVVQDGFEDTPTEARAAGAPLHHDELTPQEPKDRYFAWPAKTLESDIDYEYHRNGFVLKELPQVTDYVGFEEKNLRKVLLKLPVSDKDWVSAHCVSLVLLAFISFLHS